MSEVSAKNRRDGFWSDALVALYKGFVGIFEIALGILLLASYGVNQAIETLARNEIAEDPQDFFSHWILSHISALGLSVHVGWLLLLLGFVKLLIALGVMLQSRPFLKLTTVFLILVIAFGVYSMALKFSLLGAIMLVLDSLVLVYLWHKLRHPRSAFS